MTNTNRSLVLGVDGGGTKTLAWLALADPAAPVSPLGQGTGGPSNPRAVGVDAAGQSVRAAIEGAFEDAGLTPQPVAGICLAIAGTGVPEMQKAIQRWCTDQQFARRVEVVHDAHAVLQAGTVTGFGIALIAGTGSFAFGLSPDGVATRVGGWGYVFGDEGSGYAVGVEALRAVTKAADGRCGPTTLSQAVLQHLGLTDVADLVPTLCKPAPPRDGIASLATCVTACARKGDPTAQRILDDAAGHMADLVIAVGRRMDVEPHRYTLAMAGGLLAGCQPYRQRIVRHLTEGRRYPPRFVSLVLRPVAGAIRIARG